MIRRLLAAAISISLLSYPLEGGAQYKGLDLLGLAQQDCRMISATIVNNTAIGALEGTFGDPIHCLEQLIQTGKVPAFRIHLANGSCHRKNACEPDEPQVDDLIILKQRAKKYQELSRKYPAIKCFLSPVLEHDIKDYQLLTKIFNAVKEAAPACRLVQSAYRGKIIAGPLVEKHGNHSSGDITSNDGESIFNADASTYKISGKVITFGWIPQFNSRAEEESDFILPSKRTIRVTSQELNKVMRLLSDD